MYIFFLALLIHAGFPQDGWTNLSVVPIGFLGGGMGEFIEMCFVEHHLQEENLIIPTRWAVTVISAKQMLLLWLNEIMVVAGGMCQLERRLV